MTAGRLRHAKQSELVICVGAALIVLAIIVAVTVDIRSAPAADSRRKAAAVVPTVDFPEAPAANLARNGIVLLQPTSIDKIVISAESATNAVLKQNAGATVKNVKLAHLQFAWRPGYDNLCWVVSIVPKDPYIASGPIPGSRDTPVPNKPLRVKYDLIMVDAMTGAVIYATLTAETDHRWEAGVEGGKVA